MSPKDLLPVRVVKERNRTIQDFRVSRRESTEKRRTRDDRSRFGNAPRTDGWSLKRWSGSPASFMSSWPVCKGRVKCNDPQSALAKKASRDFAFVSSRDALSDKGCRLVYCCFCFCAAVSTVPLGLVERATTALGLQKSAAAARTSSGGLLSSAEKR